jgi:hypothetical protein
MGMGMDTGMAMDMGVVSVPAMEMLVPVMVWRAAAMA